MRTQEKIAKVLELSKEILPVKDYTVLEEQMNNKRYNAVRYWIEDKIDFAKKDLLDSIYENKYDEVYAAKYRTLRKLDNEITFLCELI